MLPGSPANPQNYIQSHPQDFQGHRKVEFFQMMNDKFLRRDVTLSSFLVLNPTWQKLHGLYCNHNRKIQLSHSCSVVMLWLSVRAVSECTHSAFSQKFPGWSRNSTAPPSAQMNQRTDCRAGLNEFPSAFMWKSWTVMDLEFSQVSHAVPKQIGKHYLHASTVN